MNPSQETDRLFALQSVKSTHVCPRSLEWILRQRHAVNSAIARAVE